jgi:hypothetical protein
MGDGAVLQLLANLADHEIAGNKRRAIGTKIWGGDLSDVISPWAVYWHIGQS